MLLQPKRTKYRKCQKGKISFHNTIRSNHLIFGNFGLMALEPARITSAQIEAARIALNRKIKKHGKLLIRIFPHIPITKKPNEVRMGQGKGPIHHWIAPVRTTQIILEVSCSVPNLAIIGLQRAANKFNILSKIIQLNS